VDVVSTRRGRLAVPAAILLAAGLVGLLSYGVVAWAPDDSVDSALGRGEAVEAPAFDLALLQAGSVPDVLRRTLDRARRDGRIALSELRGHPVVLNLWASWCEPCRTETPVLEAGWKRAARDGVVFLGLDSQDASGDARSFLREFGVTYPNVREAGRDTPRRFRATGLPETFFISADGNIVGHVIGAVDADQLRDGIASARSGRVARSVIDE
jgi:cytochrome c biogenesis protein CcmG/thiol:disulfide interchange protein DsbE